MIALIRKELREIVWVPLGFVAFMAAVTGILYLQHWWSIAVMQLYSAGLWLFVTYMGSEAIAGDGTRGLTEWSCRWPVSRLKWWSVKLLTRAVVVGLVSVVFRSALVWLSAAQHPSDPSALTLSNVLGAARNWALIGSALGVIVPFCASSATRTSVQAFGLAVVLGLVGGMGCSIPMMVYVYSHRMAMESPPLYLVALPHVVWVLAALAASAYAYVTLPVLEYGRRARRAVIPFVAAVVPMAVILVGVELASSALTKPAPQGISQASVSPDGQLIVFSDHVFAQGLWIINADGTGLRRISQERFLGHDLTWLPDSRRILIPQQVMRKEQRSGPRGPQVISTGTDDTQWSVLDTQAAKPTSQVIYTGRGNLHISPGGKYLMIGGQFIEMDTWTQQGKAEEPNYSPWFLTWLPDDSAIYVREQQPRPLRPQVKRIEVPSGQTAPVSLTERVPTEYRGLKLPAPTPLSDSAFWFALDVGTWVPTPQGEQKLVTRTVDTTTPEGKHVQKTMTFRTNPQKRLPKTVFFRVDNDRHFALDGVCPWSGSLSPSGRYCLADDARHTGPDEGAVSHKMAIVNLETGQIVHWYTLPPAEWFGDSADLCWSPDEQTMSLLATLWHGQRNQALYFLSLSGESQEADAGDLRGFGGSGVAGWTSANELVVLRQEKELVAITPQGQERVILQAHSRFVDETPGSAKSSSPQQGK